MYRVRSLLTGVAGSPWYSNLHFTSASASAADCNQAVADLWASLASTIHESVDWQTESEVATIDPDTGLTTAMTGVTALSGSFISTGKLLPMANQGLVRLRTGVWVGGKQIVGKFYIPGLSDQALLAGAPTTGFRNNCNAFLGALVSDADTELCVYSPTHRVRHVVTSVSTWDQFAVLRSRRD